MPGPTPREPVLTDDQRKMVEGILGNKPMTEIARGLGVHRQRLYEWLELAHVQQHISEVMIEIDSAIVAKLLAEINGALDLARQLRERTSQLAESKDVTLADILAATKIVDDHLKMVAELYRVATNRPSRITENRSEGAPAIPPEASRKLEALLERFTPKPPAEIDVTPTTTREDGTE